MSPFNSDGRKGKATRHTDLCLCFFPGQKCILLNFLVLRLILELLGSMISNMQLFFCDWQHSPNVKSNWWQCVVVTELLGMTLKTISGGWWGLCQWGTFEHLGVPWLSIILIKFWSIMQEKYCWAESCADQGCYCRIAKFDKKWSISNHICAA